MREAERDAEIRRDLRAVIRTAKHPDLRNGRPARLRDDIAERMALHQLLAGEPRQQIAHLRREVIRRGLGQWIERKRGASVGAWRATETEIDPPRRDRFQHA